jgi:hypothetical protein
MAHKKLLILERSGETLKTTADDGSVVLEGVFTQIGVRNKNNRIYEEKEFLPHVKDLQEKIKGKKLLGELDHPKSFDISLANVSHVIEKLEYDPSTKQVMGRIRLLDTDAGKQAKALVEAGVPLNISSRASGRVDENGKVKIQKLFTYDLVADPGFEAAELHRVNESLGFDDSDDLLIYEFEDLNSEETKVEVKPEEIVQESKPEIKEPIKENTEENTQPTMNYVKVEDFDKYSEYLKTEITQIKEEASKESIDFETFEKLVKYTEHIAEKLNQVHDYSNYLGENLDKSISHGDYIVESVNKLKDYANYLAESLQNGIGYSEYVANKLEESIKYQNYLAENVQKGIDYTEYVAENLDNSIQYQNYLAENLESSIKYSDYLKENIEKIGKYADYIAESVNRIQENKPADEETPAIKVEESVETTPEVKVEENDTTVSYQDQISKKLNALLESAVVQKEEDHFFRFLDASKRNEFSSLNESKQNEIKGAFEINKYFSVADANRIWESCFIQKPTSLDVVGNMPEKYKAKWESLNESQRSSILAQSKFWPLNTQYQIDNFWQTRDLRTVKVNSPVNESSVAPLAPEDKNAAVNEQLENIKNAIKARFDKF